MVLIKRSTRVSRKVSTQVWKKVRRGFDISFIKGAERLKQGCRRGFDDGCNESVREDFDEVVERFKRVLHRPSMIRCSGRQEASAL